MQNTVYPNTVLEKSDILPLKKIIIRFQLFFLLLLLGFLLLASCFKSPLCLTTSHGWLSFSFIKKGRRVVIFPLFLFLVLLDQYRWWRPYCATITIRTSATTVVVYIRYVPFCPHKKCIFRVACQYTHGSATACLTVSHESNRMRFAAKPGWQLPAFPITIKHSKNKNNNHEY